MNEAKWKGLAIVLTGLAIASVLTAAISIVRIIQAQRAVAECNRLVDVYRERDAEVARINRELTERNKRLEEGLGSIRDIAGTATGNIQQAISIIAGVKSILEKMEDDSYSRFTGVSSDRVGSGTGN